MNFKTTLPVLAFILCFPIASFAKDLTLTVKGMTCGSCAKGIEKKFKRNEAVKDVKADFDTGKVLISLKDKADISDDQLQKMIKDSGYSIEKIER